MTRYLISFDDGAMKFPEEELEAWVRQLTRSSEPRRRLGCGSLRRGGKAEGEHRGHR
jgi:hypothetical protein